jgi:CubicO group peptidase (beta-lactamase class C family)
MAMLTDLQDRLDEAARAHGVPGAAVAVGHAGELAEAATGVLNRNTAVAATPDSLYQIGSVTKVWTATLVMQLVDDGLLDLDRPVRHYLPSFAVADAQATEAVTVRNLLSHTAGFDGDLFEDTGRGDDALERYLAYLPKVAGQVHPVGALYSYCNAGFNVAGALVARLRGDTWEQVMRDRLIGPLGAGHMALFAEEAILFRTSAGHGVKGEVANPWQLPRSAGPAGGPACAAPRDLVRFGRMFLAGGEGLVSSDSLAAMTTPQVEMPGGGGREADRYGLGIALYTWDGARVIGHDGGTVGQSTLWRVLPEHDLVVAMNANGGGPTALFDDLLDLIVPETTGLTVPPRAVPPRVPVVPGPRKYAGSYAYPLYSFDVAATDHGLEVTETARGVAAQTGTPLRTERYVELDGDTFITANRVNGVHHTITFVDDGKYLHDGRAARRTAT